MTPAQQVADGGVELPVARGGERIVVYHSVAVGPIRCVPGGAAVHNPLGVLIQEAACHAERLEDPFACELPVGAAGDAVDDGGEQHVAGVAVAIAVAGHRIEGGLPRHQLDDVLMTDRRVEVSTTQRHQVEVVANPARMMQEVPDGDRLSVVGQLGQVHPDVIVQRERTVEAEQHDTRSRELLRDRTDIEHRLRCDRQVVVEIRDAVALCVEDRVPA